VARGVGPIHVSVSASSASSIFSLGLGPPAQFDSRIWVGARAEDVADYFRGRQSEQRARFGTV